MLVILWIILAVSAMNMALAIYLAHKNLRLIDFIIVVLSMGLFALAVHQLLAADGHLLLLISAIVFNQMVTYRRTKFYGNVSRAKKK